MHCGLDVLLIAIGDLAIYFAGGGIDVIDKLPVKGADEISPDEIFEVKRNVQLHGLKVKKSRILGSGYKIQHPVS